MKHLPLLVLALLVLFLLNVIVGQVSLIDSLQHQLEETAYHLDGIRSWVDMCVVQGNPSSYCDIP